MGNSRRKKIAVLTGGGDCPGLNAVIRAVVKAAILQYDWSVWGSEDSFEGFMGSGLEPLTRKSVQGILPRGGTILGTSNRGNPFKYPVKNEKDEYEFHDYSSRVISRFRQERFDALIAIGGDGTLTIGHQFLQRGLPVIGIPKTIDNDLLCTEQTFGFDTALHTATDAIDKIHTTAESHDRVMVVEVMGRNAGWIALEAGMAGGADVILIPEIPYGIDQVCRKIEDRSHSGSRFSVVVVAEGAAPPGGQKVYRQRGKDDPFGRLGGVSYSVADEIQKSLGVECRVLVLGHLQRGGSPSPFDRLLGTRFGWAAVQLAAQERFGRMVTLQCGQIKSCPLQDAVAHQRLVSKDNDHLKTARSLGIAFGD